MSPWEGVVIWVAVSVPVAVTTGGVLAAVRRRVARDSVALLDPSTVVLASDAEPADAES